MYVFSRRSLIGGVWALLAPRGRARAGGRSDAGVRHSFIAFGAHTWIQSEDDEIVWEWPENTRDGWVLPNGNVLLTITRARGQHGGRVIELDRRGQIVFRYDGAQDEINTCQPLPDGRVLLTEAGKNPRILEIDRTGKVAFELPIDCQTDNTHLQSRMTRRIPNGNYLVPLMGEREVREITPKGEVVWRATTPHWPFTAVRLDEGNTFVTGTQARRAFEFDRAGRAVWTLTNDDLPGEPLDGNCGGHRLANGNSVLTSYQVRDGGRAKINEITPGKKIVWSYWDDTPHGAHHVQILTTNGRAEPQPLLR